MEHFIAYGTSSGNTALANKQNGAFTSAIVNFLKSERSISLDQGGFFTEVRKDLRQLIEGQLPETSDQATYHFILRPKLRIRKQTESLNYDMEAVVEYFAARQNELNIKE